MVHRLLGLLFAAAVGAALWYGWPELTGLLREEWARSLDLDEIRLLIGVAAVFAVLALAERIWALISRLLPPAEDGSPEQG